MADAMAKGVGATVSAVNADSRAAAVDDITNHGYQVGGETHAEEDLDKPEQIRAVIGLRILGSTPYRWQ